jgi:hypothetical protein
MGRITAGVLVMVCVFATTATAQAPPRPEPGKVSAVTLYRGQAQVTRTVTVRGAAGATEVIVGPLPAQVVPESLFAEGGEGVHVRAVRHRRQAVGEEPQEQVRALNRQIEEVQTQQRATQENLNLLQRNQQSLDRLDGLLGPAAAKGAQEGKLEIDAETITKLTTFQFEQRQRLTDAMLQLQNRQRQLQEQLALLQRQHAELTAASVKYEQEAVLFLDKQAAGDAAVRLTYLVNGCGWAPAYNVRARSGGDRAQVEFNALIQQMSGEDWADIELVLSTATPALSAAAPALSAFYVGLTRVQQPQFDLNESLSNTASGGYAEARQMQQQALLGGQRAFGDVASNIRHSWRMNIAGNDMQLLEQVLPPADMERLKLSMPAEDEGPSLTYTLADRISLASRADQQIVRVASKDMPASFHHVAMPVLTSFVFREAELSNTSDTDLLGGTVSAYLDERFVGRTEVPTIARGQTFIVGFGADPQLRAEKHLAQRSESVQGGNQVVTFTYRLSVENFKGQPVPVRLKDRLPYTRNGEDLDVTITQMPTELSQDPVYRRLEQPKQILRWDITTPPNAIGENAAVVEYAYKLAYDRQLTLINPLRPGMADDSLLREFESLEKSRLRQ